MAASVVAESEQDTRVRAQQSVMHEFATRGKEFTARYPGHCELCKQSYLPGESILWMPGRAIHKACPDLPIAPTSTEPKLEDLDLGNTTVDLKDGTYTVVLDDNTYRTFRVQSFRDRAHAFFGKTIVSYLSGQDNESDFTGFAFLDNGKIRVWRRFREHADSLLLAAAQVLADPAAAGEAYAMMSGRCCRCNRKLTVPASLHRGMGPKCAQGLVDDDQ